MKIVLVEIEFLGDLLIRQIEAHQVAAQNRFAQRLMMMREDRVGQIIEVAATGLTVIALRFRLAKVSPAPCELVRLAPDAADTFRPAQLAHTLRALRVVYEVVDLEHIRSMLFSVSLSKSL